MSHVESWQQLVRIQVDVITVAGFDSISQESKSPLNWQIGFPSKCYSEVLRMEKQLHWLVNRETQGKVFITVSGDNNQVISANKNIEGNISNLAEAQNVQQQQGVGSNQSANFPSLDDLNRFVKILSEQIDELNLENEDKEHALAQINTIKSQLKSKPNNVIINESGRTLRNIIEGAVGSLTATAISKPEVWIFVQSILSVF